ncbi:MAG: thiamine-binding protein [Hyphomicrobiales bacterium]
MAGNTSTSPNSDVFLAFQVIPRVREGNNFEVVDRAIDVVKEANVPFQVGAMETTMKGPLDRLLEIVKDAQQACLDHGAVEVITNIKIHTTTPDAHDTFCTYHRGVTPSNAMFVDS